MGVNETGAELDTLLLGLVEHLSRRTGFKRESMDRLVAAGLVKATLRGSKRVVTITSEGHRRLHDIEVAQLQAESVAAVKAFVNALIVALPSALVIDAPEPWDKLEDYLSRFDQRVHFFVCDLKTGDKVRVHLHERHTQTDYSTLQAKPLHQWDITVGDWSNATKFRSRKSGMPVAEAVAEIQRQLALVGKERALEVVAAAKRGDSGERVQALHQELGLVKNDILAHLVVEANGEIRLQLPRRITFEQAEALLRAAKKVGL
jgi:DNA-binding PadR family transcriptional regulator